MRLLKAHIQAAICAMIFVSHVSAPAQIISQVAADPARAAVTLSQDTIKAGEPLKVTFSFDVPPDSDLQLIGDFANTRMNDQFSIEVNLKPGQSTVVTSTTVPANADGGDYTLSQLRHLLTVNAGSTCQRHRRRCTLLH